MGRYNEFSDDIVNALSSGALKVAEALEVQDPTGAWWRLIQAKDPTTAQVFLNRTFPDPIVADGVMTLDPMQVNGKVSGYTTGYTTYPATVIAYRDTDMEPFIISVYVSADTYMHGLIYDKDGNLLTALTPCNVGDYVLLHAVWDHVNQRVAVAARYSGKSWHYSFGLNSTAVSFGGYTYTDPSAGYMPPVSFVEAPNDIYTLFDNAGVLSVKKTTPTAGMSIKTLNDILMTSGGAVTVTAATGYRAGQVALAYSRLLQSVVVFWVEDLTGDLYFAAESEGWATPHLVATGFCAANEKLEHAGTMALITVGEDNGEYYIFHRTKTDEGILTRPGGVSYPANMKIVGATRGTSSDFRILGSVGSDWYILEVDYDTMEIKAMSPGYYAGFDPYGTWGKYKQGFFFHKLAESGDLELFVVHACGGVVSKYASHDASIICYDKANHVIKWVWGAQNEWLDSNIFPATYSVPTSFWYQHRDHFILRIADQIIFWQMQYNTSSPSEHYVIPIDTLFACQSSQDITDLLLAEYQAGRRHYISDVETIMTDPYTAYSFFLPLWASNTTTWDEVAGRYRVVLFSSASYSDYDMWRFRYWDFDMNTWDLVAVSDDYLNRPQNGYGIVAAASQYEADGTYRYNLMGTNENADPYLRWYVLAAKIGLYDINGSRAYLYSLNGDRLAHIMATNSYGHVVCSSVNGTNIYYTGLDFITGSTAQRRIPVSFTPDERCVLVSEPEDKLIYMSQITDGEIYYVKLSAFAGNDKDIIAIRSEDFTKQYEVSITDDNVIGGWYDVIGHGSYVYARSLAGQIYIVTTGAALDEFMGGTGEQGGEAQSIIYNYATQDYIPYPWEREGIRLEVSKLTKTCKVALPDTPDATIKNMLLAHDFRGCRCIIRRLFLDADLQNGAPDLPLLDGFIQDWGYSTDKGAVVFSVARPLIDITSTFPRRVMNMGCSHVFKGKRCQYQGPDTYCSKTWEDCVAKGNEQNFGGFPWVAARQRRVMWK